MGAFGLTWAAALTVAPGIGLRFFGFAPWLLWVSGAFAGLIAVSIILISVRQPLPSRQGLPQEARPTVEV